jgi:Rha family phage regulatory protein
MKTLVKIQNGKPATDSLLVSEKFGKKHFHVMNSIKNLLHSHEKSCQCFLPSNYIDESGKTNPMYIINRDGFMILTMGFTGKEALDFKFEFIEAFNRMEDVLRSGIALRVSAVEENIKRRYLLTEEMRDVNARITILMKRHDAIKKELRAIDMTDFRQLSLFPKYEEFPVRVEFPNTKRLKV